ncbi:hypothetical protein KFU94_38870 [Chloroflexi bacterium TSY]|nr:hypothetical protein [Chloroflexi bacterium TSY]
MNPSARKLDWDYQGMYHWDIDTDRNPLPRLMVVQYELQMTGSTLAIIPVIILFFALQRHIVQGVALSGLKG